MNNQNPMLGGPGPSQGCFQPFRNNYNNNPIGALQERFHREGIIPTYQLINTGGYDHARMFTMQVSLPNGLMAVGSAAQKKTAKHNAARGMLDILDGRASNVSTEVSQSITEGLKALRGDIPSPGPSPGHKTFKPKLIMNENQMRFMENQKKHQEDLLKQQLQYGPLGVKLWFSGDDKNKETAGGLIQEKPNRAPPEPVGPSDDEKLEKAHQSDFYIKDPLHEESMEEFIEKLILKSVFKEISRRPTPSDIDRLLKNSKSDPSGGAVPETICKMCNLVFRHPGDCEEHKGTADHLHVVKGYFPGEGGYHCFLCWISFQQAEGLLNHISRANHQSRCKKKGVLRVWMEPVANKSWDLLNVHKHIRDLKMEGRSRNKRSRSKERKRSSSRDRSKRKSKDRDLRDTLGKGRRDQHDDRGSIRSERRRSSEKWSHDKYSGGRSSSRSVESKSGHFEWKEVKVKNEDRLKPREREALRSSSSQHGGEGSSREVSDTARSSHHGESRSRDLPQREVFGSSSSHHGESRSREPDRDKSSSKSKVRHRERSRSHLKRDSTSTSQHRDRESSVQYDVNLYGDQEDASRASSISRKRLSESSDTSRRGKRARRMTGSDHEEVNEIQDDFEIDSVGKIENSEETLKKMKCAIIGILDEEISTLSKKIKK